MQYYLPFVQSYVTGSCVRVYEDNQGAIALAENPLSSARSKHTDVRFNFVRELLRAKKIDNSQLRKGSTRIF